MNKEEFKEFRKKIFEDIDTLMDQKNADYTAGGSVFSNFELTEEIDIPRLTGLSIRMLDKIQRLKSYIKQGNLAVQGEGIEDVFKDLIGYSFIALGMLEESKTKVRIHKDDIPIYGTEYFSYIHKELAGLASYPQGG